MTGLTEIAQHGYYYASLPWRWHSARQLRRQQKTPLCVLFYHRVADIHPNRWTMTKASFARQIDWLQHNMELISLETVQRRMQSGCNDEVAASITFDDGYAENCEFAIPLLVQRGIPCTYFVSLDFVVNQRAFPHDVENGCPLPVNTTDQLKEMADQGIEIGAHTRTHCDMGKVHDPDQLHDELIAATQELSELIGRPIRYFAFPFGMPANLSAAAAELARASGFKGVCSAQGAYCLPGEDPFHIQRIHSDPEFARFRNWLTIDPRKLSISRDFEMPFVEMLQPEPSMVSRRVSEEEGVKQGR